jgi:alpha-beta hydrolase superfamily lysophospholipase
MKRNRTNNRRRLLAAGLFALAALFACGPQMAAPQPEAVKEAVPKKKLMKDKWFNIELTGDYYMDTRLLFMLSTVWNRTADVGEVLDVAVRLRPTSELSWYREWYAAAERVRGIGDRALAAGHRVSAGEAYLRAANYYLASEVFLHTDPSDARILEAYKKGGDYFMKGNKLLGVPVELVAIPYEGKRLRGYFYKSPSAPARGPVVILHQGYDAPVEATTQVADAALKRGYNCLLFEGPGQGLAIRELSLPFRPDWEKPVGKVIDYLLTRGDVDPARLALVGTSMGGAFATRALAHEPRLKAGVLNPGYVNIYRLFNDILDTRIVNLYEEDPQAFNNKMGDLTKYSLVLRWGLNHGMWVFGATTPAGFIGALKKYDYRSDIPGIRAKVLIMDGEDEEYGKGQAKELYDLLTCPKTYLLLPSSEDTSLHCQGGANALGSARMFDWLEDNL